jgi:hypothetical protein
LTSSRHWYGKSELDQISTAPPPGLPNALTSY